MVIARRARARPLLTTQAAPLPPPPTAKKSKKKTTPVTGTSEPGAASIEGAAVGVDGTTRVEEEIKPENENNRLREQLLRVLVDHQRQEEEIVALRALARSLKEEVELIQRQNARATSNAHASRTRSDASYHTGNEKRPHEFFKLDLQVEQLRAENTRLRDELCDCSEDLETLRAFVNSELPQFKIVAVQAHAELECVKSQLHDERAHCDRLEAQVAHFKARSNVQVPTPAAQPLQGNSTRRSNSSASFADYKSAQSRSGRDDPRRRERENFLLQCRLSAMKNDSEDKENSDCGGNLRDEVSDDAEATSPPEAKNRLSVSCISVASSSSGSRASSAASNALLSSTVHRDLSGLDNELHALHQALREIPHVVHQNSAKTKRRTI